MLLGESGCFPLTVEADSEGMGLLRFSGDVASEQLCDSGQDSGSLVMERADTACADCTQWSSNSGLLRRRPGVRVTPLQARQLAPTVSDGESVMLSPPASPP